MSGPEFPLPVGTVIATIAELFRLQGGSLFVDILNSAKPRIEATAEHEWDPSITYYTLYLEIPIPLFAKAEPKLPAIEQAIEGKFANAINRSTGNDTLRWVVISPVLQQPMATQARPPAATDVERIWSPGMFRLFISHVAAHKVAVSALKYRLSHLGISGFVAHEDIEPTREWELEIANALRSMQGLLALLTTDFHGSNWTDQEVGAAVARGVTIIPVRLGLVPYGFMSRHQAMRGELEKPVDLAAAIAAVLLKRASTTTQMREALVIAIEQAPEYAAAVAASKLIVQVDSFSQQQLSRIEASIGTNPQVSGAYGVPERLKPFLSAKQGRLPGPAK